MRKFLLIFIFVGMFGMTALHLRGQTETKILSPAELQSRETFYKYFTARQKPETVYKLCLSEISRIPDDFDILKKLHVLEIGVGSKDKELTELPPHFYNLPNLTRLAIENTSVGIISSSVQNFKQLRFLSIKNNPVGQLPREISRLELLDTLYADKALLPKDILASNIKVLQTRRADIPPVLSLEEVIYEGDSVPKNLNKIRNLKKILFTSPKLNPRQGIEQIQVNKKVTHVGVNAKSADPYVWEKLSRMEWLKRLEIYQPNTFSAELLKIKGLLELTLTDFQCYDPAGCARLIENVAKAESIYKLTVNRYVFNFEILKKLKEVHILKSTDYQSLSGKKWLKPLATLPDLEVLNLFQTDLSRATELRFDSLMKVKVLNLAYTKLPGETDLILQLAKMPKLERLIISSDDMGINLMAPEWAAVGKIKEILIYNVAAQGRRTLSENRKKEFTRMVKCPVRFIE